MNDKRPREEEVVARDSDEPPTKSYRVTARDDQYEKIGVVHALFCEQWERVTAALNTSPPPEAIVEYLDCPISSSSSASSSSSGTRAKTVPLGEYLRTTKPSLEFVVFYYESGAKAKEKIRTWHDLPRAALLISKVSTSLTMEHREDSPEKVRLQRDCLEQMNSVLSQLEPLLEFICRGRVSIPAFEAPLEALQQRIGAAGTVVILPPFRDTVLGNRHTAGINIRGMYRDDGVRYGWKITCRPLTVKQTTLRIGVDPKSAESMAVDVCIVPNPISDAYFLIFRSIDPDLRVLIKLGNGDDNYSTLSHGCREVLVHVVPHDKPRLDVGVQ